VVLLISELLLWLPALDWLSYCATAHTAESNKMELSRSMFFIVFSFAVFQSIEVAALDSRVAPSRVESVHFSLSIAGWHCP
jgi:hypothetical protein